MSTAGGNISNISPLTTDKIWLTTDWHLHHVNILRFENRPEGFEKLIYENIRREVKSDEIIINLGDVIFKRQGELIQIMSGMPGIHVLVMGNHDRNKPNWYRTHGFHWVSRTYEYKDILFSHRPMDLSHWPNLKYNIHGHFHTNDRSREDRTPAGYTFYTENHFLLSLERMNYQPIRLKEFMLMNGVEYIK